jgi:hypothetical protein
MHKYAIFKPHLKRQKKAYTKGARQKPSHNFDIPIALLTNSGYRQGKFKIYPPTIRHSC